MTVDLSPEVRACSVAGCARRHYGKALCEKHWNRVRRTGSTEAPRLWRPVVADSPRPVEFGSLLLPRRFWKNVTRAANGCWRWDGLGRNQSGHGHIKVGGTMCGTHRLAYMVFVGAIPEGHHLDHFRFPEQGCVGPECCHPEHVRPATPRENTLRGDGPTAANRAKTNCGACGRSLSGPNLYVRPDSARACRECKRAATRAWRRRSQAADGLLSGVKSV